MRTLEQIQQRFERWPHETDTQEAYSIYCEMRDADFDLGEMLEDEKDEEKRALIDRLRSEIAPHWQETELYRKRLLPLQWEAGCFADELEKLAKEVEYSELVDKCSEIKSSCDYQSGDFYCCPGALTMNWGGRVLLIRAALLAVRDDVTLRLKNAQYDRYRENIEQLQAKYKDILDYLEQWDESKARAKRIAERIKDDQSGQPEKPAETGQKGKADNRDGDALTKAERCAYESYGYAVNKQPRLLGATDNKVYDWLKENGTEGDYELPRNPETWKRQVRAGRKYHGEHKNTPRAGRQTRSVIRASQIQSLSEISSQYDDKAD